MATEQAQHEREALLSDALSRDWYHTIELGSGQATPGFVDLREPAAKVLPADLTGLRALDVGTFDGFWAFELERRGAETLAADLDVFNDTDWPPPTQARLKDTMGQENPGERFHIAHRLLDSRVKRVGSSIYDLDVAMLDGPVDFVFIGALLLHLRDPVRGLQRVREVMNPGGRIVLVEPVDLLLSIFRRKRPSADMRAARTSFDWWVGNVACLRAWLSLAGFADAQRKSLFRIKATENMRQWHAAVEATVPAS